MKAIFVLILCAALVACGKSQSDRDAARASVIGDVSGVWSSSSAGLITIDDRGKQLRFLIGDDPKVAKLGDVDTVNRTVNLLLKRTADGKQIVWTLRRVRDANRTSFHLDVVLDDGSHAELPFVRQVTRDDLDRIASLYQQAGKLVAVNPAPGPVTAAKPAAVTPRVPQALATTVSHSGTEQETPPAQTSLAPEHRKPPPDEMAALPPQQPEAPQPRKPVRKTADEIPTEAIQNAGESAAPAPRGSLDCTRALTAPEQVVCSDTFLMAEDTRLEALFATAVEGPYAREARVGQRYWRNNVRTRCYDSECMRYAYAKRIEELNALLTDAPRGRRAPSTDNLSVVREFYHALGRGDGEAAADFVVPERREAGALSAAELDAFHRGLASQFALDGVDQSDGNQVIAHYRYVAKDGRVCAGYSFVRLVERGGSPMIAGVEKANGC